MILWYVNDMLMHDFYQKNYSVMKKVILLILQQPNWTTISPTSFAQNFGLVLYIGG